MSRYTGPQGRGARRVVRQQKADDAVARQESYRARTGKGCDPTLMARKPRPVASRGEAVANVE